MKVTISPHMHCGLANPEMDATPEIQNKLYEMMIGATEPSDDRSIDYKMPPNGFFINFPMINVHVANGTIAIRVFGITSYVKDTVGLEFFLSETMAPCLQDYHEKMYRVSKQEEVQHAEGGGNGDPDA